MGNFNRGEWSEIYAILYLLLNPNLSVSDSKLENITNQLYNLKKISIVSPSNAKGVIEYCLNSENNVEIIYDNELEHIVSKIEMEQNKQKIFDSIINAPIGNGSFEIVGLDGILAKLTKGKPIKSKSFNKEDIGTLVHDNRIGRDAKLNYSIKSSLGSPATILNSSNHTNFLYSVIGINENEISNINNLDGHSKLVDRIKYIMGKGGKILFEKVCDDNFNYNLKMIDSNMPKYLANVLLESYSSDNKNLKELFLNSNDFEDEDFALKKLGDFLEGISFGFFPSAKWDGKKQVNGGLVIVKKDGNVVILDLVYYRNEVINYLINETKLDTPSSSRYGMLNLFKCPDSDKIYFTLNLQVRYKK